MSPPAGLQASSFVLGTDEYVLLEFPLPQERDSMNQAAGLTASERAVAELALRGWSNAEIAGARSTSPRTVANQLASIYRKLGVSSRRELFARHQSGLT